MELVPAKLLSSLIFFSKAINMIFELWQHKVLHVGRLQSIGISLNSLINGTLSVLL